MNSLLTQGSSLVQLGKIEAQSKLNDLPELRYVGMMCVCAIPVCGNAFLSNPGSAVAQVLGSAVLQVGYIQVLFS